MTWEFSVTDAAAGRYPWRERPACDCAGTAPGYPQHESGCASRRVLEPPPVPEELLSDDPAWTTDPRPAVPLTDTEPF
jgi:hypothetical protein